MRGERGRGNGVLYGRGGKGVAAYWKIGCERVGLFW